MILAAILFSIATDAQQFCPSPDVRSYIGCESVECAALGRFVAREFPAAAAAATALAALPPEQAYSAQIVTLSRSETPVLVWRPTQEEIEERHGIVQTIVVKAYTPKAIGSRDAALQGALTHFTLDYLSGVDVAFVTTNDPAVTALVVMRTSAQCGTARRRAARH